MRALLSLIAIVGAAMFLAGCGGATEPAAQLPAPAGATAEASAPPLPQGSETVELDPADFVPRIDNQYWPMNPGDRWIYRESDVAGAKQRVTVTVTDGTKDSLGIQATVVHDVVTEDGAVIEDTFDWYAQDRWGNVWYLGEDTKEFENGKVVSTEGSWEAGVDGAQAGVLIPGDPVVGQAYRQEYLEGVAEDAGAILSLDEQVSVPFGSFTGVLMTKDWTPLEPDLVEHKFYAKGVGPVLALDVSGGSGREELVEYRPRPKTAAEPSALGRQYLPPQAALGLETGALSGTSPAENGHAVSA